jgi:DNA invertase Pin-like site-specific DNA recombinase
MNIRELEEKYKQRLLEQVEFIVEQGLDLNIIYLRVSTKTKGQDERDQLKDILKAFNLIEDQCIIIGAKESAYKISTQKNRRLNLVDDICKKYDEENKTLYIWDLDRLYRNRELQYTFIKKSVNKYNMLVYSYRQTFMQDVYKQPTSINKLMYDVMIMMFGYFAEEESKKRADRVKKSYHKKDNRTYTNKNRLVGRKLKTINGKKINLKAEQLDKLELFIIKKFKEGWSYQRLINYIATKNIKVSVGYLNNVKKKYR